MKALQKLRQLVRGTLDRVVRFSVYKHANVSMPPYDIFSAVIETRKWGFGFRVENWRDRFPAHDEWGLRIQFWKWHLIVAIKANMTGEPRGASPRNAPPACSALNSQSENS